MNFIKFASITKKITLAVLGLFLMAFLLLHMGINLCMLRSDGGEWFRAAAHFMGTNYIIKAIEPILFICFILHLLLGVFLQIQNWRARPIGYKISPRSKTSPGSKLMIYTGAMIFVFLAVHMMNFYFVKLGFVEGKYVVEMKALQNVDPQILQENQEELVKLFQNSDPESMQAMPFKNEAVNVSKEQIEKAFGENFKEYEPDFYTMGIELFRIPWYSIFYLIMFIALGFHLYHAFSSAFQTLGLNHPKYMPIIKCIGLAYTLIIVIGFSIIPIWFLLF